jgi:sulfur carrier protein
VQVTVNGEDVDVDENATVETLLASRGLPAKGIAVALDWTVLPRSEWDRVLPAGARVEIVTAVQGG